MSFFAELKRRNVFRAGLAYGITAWLVAQVAGLAAAAFFAPDWVMKMIITVLILGLPLAMLMAWAYEMTPQGLRRESLVEEGRSTAQATAGKLDKAIAIALVLAVAYIAYDNLVVDPRREAALKGNEAVQATDSLPGDEPAADAPAPQEDSSSIAVLPFVNMSDDPGNEYFSEGLSEELLNLLVRIPELKVAARTSSFSYKGKDVKIAQIGEELNVAHVLEGSVRKAGDQVRITAQLIKADDGYHLWSKTYDRTLENIFVTQDEIAAAVVEALKVSLLGALPQQRETDPEVYALYLQGRYLSNIKNEESLRNAVEVLEQALAIDPGYAPAWIGINVAYQEQAKYGWRPHAQAMELSMAATEKALAIDPDMAEAWASLAYLRRGQWDWAGAEAAVNRAQELAPNHIFVMGTAATLAGTFGQLEKSVELFEKIVKVDPLSQSTLRALSTRYMYVGNYDKAIETAQRLLSLNPGIAGANTGIGLAYLLKGDAERALIEFAKDPSNPGHDHFRARALSTLGREAEAQALIDELLVTSANDNPVTMAGTYAWRGENDLAFEWFEKGLERRDYSLAFFLRAPWIKNLESDPRYPGFVEKLGLLDYWKAIPPEHGGPARAP